MKKQKNNSVSHNTFLSKVENLFRKMHSVQLYLQIVITIKC